MTAPWRPGDRRPDVDAMLRVDQAGEYGATRIYAGQLAVLGDSHKSSAMIAGMAAPMVRCDDVQWSWLGISMAGWNAILSLASALVILWLSLKQPRTA